MFMDNPEKIQEIIDNFSDDELEDFDGHLIVDDIDNNRKILSKMLSILKINSEQASNGLEAVEMASKKRYELIWMDIKMPVMNGIESTKNIRQHIKFNGPIYATTAYTDVKTQKDCIDAGINKIIAKPISIKMIKEISDELKEN